MIALITGVLQGPGPLRGPAADQSDGFDDALPRLLRRARRRPPVRAAMVGFDTCNLVVPHRVMQERGERAIVVLRPSRLSQAPPFLVRSGDTGWGVGRYHNISVDHTPRMERHSWWQDMAPENWQRLTGLRSIGGAARGCAGVMNHALPLPPVPWSVMTAGLIAARRPCALRTTWCAGDRRGPGPARSRRAWRRGLARSALETVAHAFTSTPTMRPCPSSRSRCRLRCAPCRGRVKGRAGLPIFGPAR